MKRFLLLALLIISFFGLNAHTFTATYGGNTLYFNTKTTPGGLVAEVTYNSSQGYNSAPNTYYAGFITIPETVVYQGSTLTVASIGDDAFRGRQALISVEIPNTVTSIGNRAFQGCSGLLAGVSIPSSVTSFGGYIFAYCQSIVSVNWPSTISIIPVGCFYECNNLTSVSIPNTVTRIYDYAFAKTGLMEVRIPKQVERIYKYAFQNCYNLSTVYWDAQSSNYYNTYSSNSLSDGNYSPFEGCNNLTDIIISDTVVTLPTYAFQNLPRLQNITFSNNMTYIPRNCFYNCDGLKNVNITAPITSVGSYAFANCDSLETIGFPDTLLYIRDYTFLNCYRLNNVTIPKYITEIGKYVFQNCSGLTTLFWNAQNSNYYYYNGASYILSNGNYPPFEGCNNLTDIIISDTVVTLPTYAFQNLPRLQNVSFSNNMNYIPKYCFYNCDGLKNVNITAPITTMGSYAFANCDSLETVGLPNTLIYVGANAFQNCYRLNNITLPNSVTHIYEYAFAGSGIQTINIPRYMGEIHKYAFRNCSKLTTLYWNAHFADYYYYNGASSVLSNGDYPPFEGCNNLTDIIISDTVETIPTYAFQNLPRLQNISFSNNMTYIPKYCFYNCDGLKNVNITAPITILGSYAFANCDSLETIGFPSTLLYIRDYTFLNCYRLNNVTIPKYVTEIGKYVFQNCSGLTTLFWNAQNSNYYYYNGASYILSNGNYPPFEGCNNLTDIIISDTVQTLPTYAFQNLPRLRNVSFSNNMTSIPRNCFYNCDGLKNIDITAPITLLSIYSFANCDSLETVGLPNTLINVGANAFQNCYRLNNITLPNSVTHIYEYAFAGSGIQTINIPRYMGEIHKYAFRNCSKLTTLYWNAHFADYYYYNGASSVLSNGDYPPFEGCNNLTDIIISDTVETIPTYAFQNLPRLQNVSFSNNMTYIPKYCFYNCDRLKNINITAPVTSLGNYAFANCDSLEIIGLPNTLLYIRDYAFSGCSQLTSINLPSTLTLISNYAFNNCTGISSMSVHATTPPTLSSNAFNNVSRSIPVTVPCVAKAAYQSTNNWSSFTNYQGYGDIRDTLIMTTCDEFTWRGNTYSTSGTYSSTNTYNDCDSVHVLILSITSSVYSTETIIACNSYTWHGTTYTASTNTPTYTTTSSSGCDSVVTLHLTIMPNLNISFHANGGTGQMAPLTVCLGDYATLPYNTFTRLGYNFLGWATTPNGAVVYSDGAYFAPFGDLSLYAVWSSSCYDVHHAISTTACDSYYWRGNTYTNSGTYTDIVTDAIPGGCDSIFTLDLTINYSVSSIEEITACNSYTWHGNTYTASTNTPIFTTTSSSGCDSVVTLHLTILPNLNISFHANGGVGYMAPLTVCLGDYATLPNNTFTRLGYSFSGWSTTPNGAVMYQDGAQIITSTNLSLYAVWSSSCSNVHHTISATACDSYYWRGNTYTNSGTYTSTVTGVVPGGCDSIYTLNLTINHSVSSIEEITACNSYTWHGNTYTASTNTPTYTTTSSSGCDSVVTLHLTILPNLTISFHANGGIGYMAPLTVCLGDYATLPNNTFTRLGYSFSGWSTTPNGAVMYQDGAQIITSTNLSLYAVWSSSCSNVHHTVSATACDSYYWRGNTYTNSGTYTSTASGVVPGGCDSIYTLNLTINYSVSSIEEITACNSYTWHGNTYTASTNTPTYTTTSSSGCDSVVTLHLTILPNLTISFHANGGIGYMAPLTVCLGNYATLPNNTFTRLGYSFSGWSTAPNGAVMYQDGAQIITSTDLSLYAIWNSSCSDVYDTLSVSSCDFFTWRGITYTNSGTYTSIVTDVVPGGCDSIYTLNLTINHGTTGIDSIVACDSYTWFGNTYTSSNNTATVLLINSAGCDSLVTLNLTINYSTSSEFWITEEDSYTWNGITYNETGDYVQVLATVDGCDSTVTLHLTITVGIDEPQTSIVPKVHPNPTSGIIIVDSDIIDRIDIYDNLGRMIRSFNNDNTINIQDLPPAVYILRVITPNNTTIHRIIKN